MTDTSEKISGSFANGNPEFDSRAAPPRVQPYPRRAERKQYPNKSSHIRVAKQKSLLGMHPGSAANKLRKHIMFDMVVRLELDTCFHCGEKIKTPRELSVEHKTPWEGATDPRETFFDLDNIAFSHLGCNAGDANRRRKALERHGTQAEYQQGCRCEPCIKARREYNRNYMREWQRKKRAALKQQLAGQCSS